MSDNPRDGDAGRPCAINTIVADAIDPVADQLPASVWDKLHDSFSVVLSRYAAALRKKDEEIAFLHSVLEGFSEAIKQRDMLIFGGNTTEAEIERLKSEIASLRATPAARVVKAARDMAFPIPFPPTAEIQQLDALERRDRLRQALAEYDATAPPQRTISPATKGADG